MQRAFFSPPRMFKVIGVIGIIVIGTALVGGVIGYAIGRQQVPAQETPMPQGGAGAEKADAVRDVVASLARHPAATRFSVTLRGTITALAEPAFAITAEEGGEELPIITMPGESGTRFFETRQLAQFEGTDVLLTFGDLRIGDRVEVYTFVGDDAKIRASAVQRLPSP